jgi:hypothetical protein
MFAGKGAMAEVSPVSAEVQNTYNQLVSRAAEYSRYNAAVPADLQAQIDKYSQIITKLKDAQTARDNSHAAPGGNSTPTKNLGGSDLIAVNIPNVAPEIDSATAAWARSNQAMQAYYTGWAGNDAKFVAAIRPTEELRAKVNSETWKKIESDWKDAEQKNKATVEDMKQKWQDGSQNISSGWMQACEKMKADGLNWTQAWSGMFNQTASGMTTAIHSFVNTSGDEFKKFQTMLGDIFKSILSAFESMVEQMLAKWALLNVLGLLNGTGGVNLFSGVLGSRASGGPIPQTGNYLMHSGEYVLPADVVSAIKSNQAPASISPSGSLSAGGSPSGPTISQTIVLQGSNSDADIGALCEKISEATRNGLRQAGEMANVITKVGAKKAGVTAL